VTSGVRHTTGGWDPRPVLDHALDPSADRRVLKAAARRLVVRLEGAGPRGEPVVIKRARLGLGARIRALFGETPAESHWRGARLLTAAGIGTAEPLAVLEERGADPASTVVCAALDDAEPLRSAWLSADRRSRRRLAEAMGEVIAALHRTGVYVPDLRDANLMVRRRSGADEIVVVDLDRCCRPYLGLSARRRIANLVQLERTLGCYATTREKLVLLGAYRRGMPDAAGSVSDLARAVERARRHKDGRVARRRRRESVQPDERVAVSAIVVCGDEIDNIRTCLASLAWCDELIVVDSYSTDGTFDIVRAFATRAVRRPWPGHRAQKQYALELATKPWVLNVDADECVPDTLRAEVEAVLAHDGAGYDGFEIPRLVEYLGRSWRRGGWYPDRKLRLFRRARARWGGIDPHERAVVPGRIGRLRTPLVHRTYEDVADHVDTIDRFTTTAAAQRTGRPTAARLVLRPLARFTRFYLLQRAFLEGFPGLFLAITAGVYTYLKYAKLDEHAKPPRNEATAPRQPCGSAAPRGPSETGA
jgi:tRNA A-37 threonylcarbamoyl transferase component Bud32